MRNLRILGAVSAMAVASFAGRAEAQTAPSGVSIGVERAFGLEIASETSEFMGAESTDSVTTIGLGLNGGATAASTARVGVDYIMDGGVSVGTGIGFATYSFETEGDAGSSDGPSLTRIVFAPRAGYFMMFSPSVGLWPRGGITYASTSSESEGVDFVTGMTTTTESSSSDLALTLEVPLVVMPAPNFGFQIAGTLDYGLSHTDEVDGTESDIDVSVSSFGIQFGVFGVL